MSKNNVVKFEDCFNLPNQGLKTYFDRTRKGNDQEYRTKFYRNKSVSQVLEDWMPQLKTLEGKWPSLLEFENDLARKVGPMSIQKPLSERMDDIESYYDGILLPSEPVSERAIKAVLAEWGHVRGMHLRNQHKTVELMKKSTNSGSPFFTKRRNVTGKTIPCQCYQEGNATWQILSKDMYQACAVLGWRGQEGGPDLSDVKQRVVWMFPYAVNIQELQVYQPLIEGAQKHGIVPAWIGMESVDERITALFDTKAPEDLIVCTDFSKFDQHFGKDLQSAAKTILHGILAGPEAQNWLNTVFPIKYEIPLAYDYGEIKTGPHGMGSGSGGTNADETLVHRALQYEAAQKRGKRLNPNSQCLGDDGILTYPGITAEDVMQTYTSHGLEMNSDKQYVSTQDCTYLRRWHHKDYRENGICVGVYATTRALGRLCEQERFYDPDVWGPKMVALRQLSIIENCKWHPLREEFAEFCMKGDKYRLGIDIPGFLEHIEDEAQEAIELMPDFLGYTRSLSKEASATKGLGISNWWIVNYLRSKA